MEGILFVCLGIYNVRVRWCRWIKVMTLFFISMFLLNSSLLPFFFPEQNLCCNLGVPLNSELYALKIKLSGVLAYMWKAVMPMHALVCFTVYHL
jgi:hypothetical protein